MRKARGKKGGKPNKQIVVTTNGSQARERCGRPEKKSLLIQSIDQAMDPC